MPQFFLDANRTKFSKFESKFPDEIYLPLNTGRYIKRQSTSEAPFKNERPSNSIELGEWIQFAADNNIINIGGGGGGGTDYISNVVFSSNFLTFTGVGNAFNGSVNLNPFKTIPFNDYIQNVQLVGTSLSFTNNGGSAFSGSIDLGPILPTADYVSNVSLVNNILSFTGMGGAFNGNIDLTNAGTNQYHDAGSFNVPSSTLTLTSSNGLADLVVTGVPIDYISNVSLVGTDLTFTGTGNAFNSTVSLSALFTDTNNFHNAGTFDGGTGTLTLTSANGAPSIIVAGFPTSGGGADGNSFHNAITFDTVTNILELTSVNGAPTINVDLSDLQDAWVNNYVTGASFSGTTTKTLTLTRSGGLPNLTAAFTDDNNFHTSLSFDNATNVLTLSSTNGAPSLTADLSDLQDAWVNSYVTGVSVTGAATKTLTLTRNNGLPNLTTNWTDIDTNDIDYVSNVTLVGTNLTFAGVGNAFASTVNLASINTNNFHTALAFNPTTNVLSLTSSNGAPSLTVDLSDLQDAWVDNYVDSVAVTGTGTKTLTVGRTGALPDLTANWTDENFYHTSMTYNGTTNVLELTSSNGAPTLSVDLTDLQDSFVDSYVTSAAVTGTTTKTLTLTRSNGLPNLTANWTVDGSETKLSAGTDIGITGSGTIGSPYVINYTGSASLPSANVNETMRYNGVSWVASGNLLNNDTHITIGAGSAVNRYLELRGSGSNMQILSQSLGAGTFIGTINASPLSLMSNSSTYLGIATSGQLTFNSYGIGTHTGTAAKYLAVTAGGALIEEPIPSSLNGMFNVANQGGTWAVTSATLGGNTTISGASTHNLIFSNLSDLDISSVTTDIISTGASTLQSTASTTTVYGATSLTLQTAGTGKLYLKTPNVVTATASANQVLTLINATTGETEFATLPGITSFTVAGSTGSNQTITDGNTLTIAGTNGLGSVGVATDTVQVKLGGILSENTTIANTTFNYTMNSTTGNMQFTSTGAGFIGFQAPTGGVRIGGGATPTELRFYEASAAGTNYVALKATNMAANTSYTLPVAFPTVAGQVLSSTTSGVMSWTSPSGGGTFTISDGTTSQTVTINSDTVTFNNGLSVSATDTVKLGGTLTAATTITQGANNFTFSGTSGGFRANATGAATHQLTTVGGTVTISNTTGAVNITTTTGNVTIGPSTTGNLILDGTRIDKQGTEKAFINSRSSGYTIVPGVDSYVYFSAAAGAATINLPLSPTTGDTYHIKCTDITNTATLNGNGSTIDGASTWVYSLANQAITVIYNGTQWLIY